MRKNYLLFIIIVFSLLFNFVSLVLCQDQVTIEYWTFVDPKGENVRSRTEAYVQQKFLEKYPNINLNVRVMQWQQIDSMLIRAVETKQPPDVILIYQPSLKLHINAGTIQPIDTFVETMTEEQKADFVAPWELTMWEGHKYGLHFDHRITGVFYRQDLLDENGLTYPQSLDEFVDQAGKLSNPPDMIGFVNGINGRSPIWLMEHALPMAASAGGKVIYEDGRSAMDTEAWAKVVEIYKKLIDTNAIPLDVALQDVDSQYGLALTGKFLFMPHMSHRLEHVRETSGLGDKVQFGVIPSFDLGVPSPTIIAGWILVIPTGAKHPNEAWKFIEHAISADMQAYLAEHAGYIPVRKSVVKDFEWFTKPEARDVVKIIDMAKNTLVFDLPENYNELFTFAGRAFEKVYLEDSDPLSALKEFAEEYNKSIK